MYSSLSLFVKKPFSHLRRSLSSSLQPPHPSLPLSRVALAPSPSSLQLSSPVFSTLSPAVILPIPSPSLSYTLSCFQSFQQPFHLSSSSCTTKKSTFFQFRSHFLHFPVAFLMVDDLPTPVKESCLTCDLPQVEKCL